MLIWFSGLSWLLSQRKLTVSSDAGRGKRSREVQFISEVNRKKKANVEATCANLRRDEIL